MNSRTCFPMLFLSMVYGVSCASHQLPESAGAEWQPATITSSESCFSGPYENYESWLGHLKESKPRFNVAALAKRIPKERFERAKSQLDCQRFQYAVGDITVAGYSVRKHSPNGKLPVVIYNRGGNASHGRIEFRTLFQRMFHLADEGFFVIASQYRGSGLVGGDATPGADEFGGKDIDDVMSLFDLIDNSRFTDKNRIGMFGWSRGAIMTFIVATRTDRLSALVVGGAPTDIAEELKARPGMERVFAARIPDYNRDKTAALKSRSVLEWAEKLPKSTPILILHGQSDTSVTVDSALELAREMQTQGISYRLVIYENGRHALLEYRQSVNEEISAWFAEKLK